MTQDGWLAVPFACHGQRDRIVCGFGDTLVLQATPQVPLRGPFGLAITGGLHVEELLFGLITPFVNWGAVSSEYFQGTASRRDPKPWELLPLEGPVLVPGVMVTLRVRNVSRVNLYCEPVLWGCAKPLLNLPTSERVPGAELERERRRIIRREEDFARNVEACSAELERRERKLREEREQFAAEMQERESRLRAEEHRRAREQIERDPAWIARKTDRELTERARARSLESTAEPEGGAWATACDES